VSPATDTKEFGMFVYEATVTLDEGGYYFAEFDQLQGCFADGESFEEVVSESAEALRLMLAYYIDNGKRLPEPIFKFSTDKVLRIAVAVDIDDEYILESKCLSIKDAAKELGVTTQRVSKMIDDGILETIPFGNDRLVTIASVNERLANPRGAGRPRKLVEA